MPGSPSACRDGRTVRYDTVKARLYPTPEQVQLFEKTFGCCRYVWNRMLSDQQRFYEETGTHFIPTPAKYKNSAPFLKEVDNQTLIQEHNQLSKAFRTFFKNPAAFGHPQFKRKKDDRDSFTACNHAVCPTIWLTNDGIRMTKAGVVRAKFPRRPRSDWTLKRITVVRTKTGKFFCCILFEYAVKVPEQVLPTPETTLGLKYSVPHFYVTDQGAKADPPHWLRDSQEKLARLQKQLSRMTPGSKNYQDTVLKFQKLHEHIANQRLDYIHKESRRIANSWNAVCVRADDLNLVRGKAGFGIFRLCLQYKLERLGKTFLLVDRGFPSTRICHCCGFTLPEAVSYKRRTWTCPSCGHVLNRERNAAQNIKDFGLAKFHACA